MERVNKSLSCILLVLLTIVLIVCAFPINSAHADMGPKPSFKIYIGDLPQSDYVITIMLTSGSEGQKAPYILHDTFSSNNDERKKINKLIDRLNNENIDASYITNGLIGRVPEVKNDTTSISYSWTYYAPSDFIIVFYDLNNDILYVSNNIHRIAFTTAYTATYDKDFTFERDNYVSVKAHETLVSSIDPNLKSEDLTEDQIIKLNVVYNVLLFLARLAFTLGIEMLLALAFKFTKESYKVIAITNVITQILLNIFIWLGMIYAGLLIGLFGALIVGEFFVFIAEPIVYHKKCIRQNGTKKLIVFYALLANFLSLAIGVGLGIVNCLI